MALIGGGTLFSHDLALALGHARMLVAADGGAGAALDLGHLPDAVLGDLDSLTPAHRAEIPDDRLFLIPEQDTTDFDKALRNIEAPLVLAVGFLGARIDHQLAVFNTLVRLANRPCILLGETEIILHAPPLIELELDPGAIVSLFPMTAVKGRSDGLRWPIEGLDFSPVGRVGTSNTATGPIRLEFEQPGMLLILPRAALDRVIRAFSAPQTELWSARGE
ncbi:MAG: thiamine diphosphokinase [Pseudomonadota bacterium]